MVRNRLSGKRLTVAVTTAAVVAAGLASTTDAGAAPVSTSLAPGIDTAGTAVKGPTDKGLALPAGVPTKGSYAFLLRLDAKSTASAQQSAAPQGVTAGRNAARTQLSRIATEQTSVVSDLPRGTSVLYRTHATLAGVAVRTDVKNFAALTRIDGVSAVYPIAPKKATNATAVPLQGAPAAWTAYGDRGQNSTIAIIDTGIDYTHADFGGPGTTAAYEAAHANEAGTADPSLYPNAKVVGGYDFVGDAYNADPTPTPPGTKYPYNPVTKADDNPLDCGGHGSHVAGSAAGYGVDAEGKQYRGTYNRSTPFGDLRIGPGMAPLAKLYAFRVFGCAGSTDVTAAAIERAMDPNGDGDTSDHVDVANLSLGSDFGSPQDGDTVVVEAASKAGVTMVISSGNNGDLYDTGGSPGNARSALTVAASQDSGAVVDTLNVATPAGNYPAQRSVAYDYSKGDLAGDVYRLTDPANADGCQAYTGNDLTGAKGKVVFLEWTDTDADRACGSVQRHDNAAAGGAIGFVLGNDEENFAAGITGGAKIPGVIVAKSGADAIRSALEAGTTVTVGSTTANGSKQDDPALNDTLADFSSRGVRSAGNLKPDVTAVGATVFSAAVGTGNEGVTESGTSMSAPMTSGLAGLVKSLHPEWTPEQVKADIVNTAGQNLFVKPNHEGRRYAPNRVGTGRIDAKSALDNSVLAYVTDDPGAVSASFGPLEVTADTQKSKTIRVQNTGNSTVTYNVSLQDRTTIPGVEYSVSPTTVTIDPRSSRTVLLTLTISKAALTKTIDPTVDREQGGLPREYLADASGLVLLKPTAPAAPTLRVAYYSAPRPTSTMTQPASVALPDGAVQTADLPLTGDRVRTEAGPTNVTSTVAGFELQATSPALPTCTATVLTGCVHSDDEKSGDLKYVGVTSSAPQVTAIGEDPLTSPDGLAYFAISTQGPWRSPVGFQEYDVYLDTTGDGVADVYVYNTRVTGSDVFVASVYSFAAKKVVASYPINDRFGDTDTALFDSDTLVLPVQLTSLPGITATNSRITYSVESAVGASGLLDTVGGSVDDKLRITGGLSFDVLRPGVAVYGSYNGDASPLLYADSPGTLLKLRRDSAAYAADKGQGALVVHFQNAVGDKAQVVSLKAPSTTTLTIAPSRVVVGSVTVGTITVSGAKGTATGTVTLKSGDTVLGSRALVDGKAQIGYRSTTTGLIPLTATYAGTDVYEGSTSATATLSVVPKPPSTMKLSMTPSIVRLGAVITTTINVSNSEKGAASGTYTFQLLKADGTVQVLRTGTLPVSGAVSFGYKPTAVGRFRYQALYGGNPVALPSSSAAVGVIVNK